MGTVVDPISVDAGGVLSTTTTGPTGDIYLRSLHSVNLGQLRALDAGEQTISLSVAGDLTISGATVSNDNWELLADDNITFGAGGQITANEPPPGRLQIARSAAAAPLLMWRSIQVVYLVWKLREASALWATI